MKKSNETIGNRTRDLPACSAVPQPTAPPCALIFMLVCGKYYLCWNLANISLCQYLATIYFCQCLASISVYQRLTTTYLGKCLTSILLFLYLAT